MKNGLFTVEGKKGIFELLNSPLELHSLFTTEDFCDAPGSKSLIITEADLKKISSLSTPQTALAVFHIPEAQELIISGLQVVLDEVQDPGNLGTIIRLCDWFGVEDLICSKGTVDCYNPKVVQATMGSIARVRIHYLNIADFLEKAGKETNIYGTFLEGENVYAQDLPENGIIVLGNEANGISPKLEGLINRKLLIPQFSQTQKTESLNVATAAAIFLSEFRRKNFTGR